VCQFKLSFKNLPRLALSGRFAFPGRAARQFKSYSRFFSTIMALLRNCAAKPSGLAWQISDHLPKA
jgi:hypothetical protein